MLNVNQVINVAGGQMATVAMKLAKGNKGKAKAYAVAAITTMAILDLAIAKKIHGKRGMVAKTAIAVTAAYTYTGITLAIAESIDNA